MKEYIARIEDYLKDGNSEYDPKFGCIIYEITDLLEAQGLLCHLALRTKRI